MMKRAVAPLVVIGTLVLASFFHGPQSAASAASTPSASPAPFVGTQQAVTQRSAVPPNEPGQDGTDFDEVSAALYTGGYPQAVQKTLTAADYVGQPRTVPHDYVPGQLYNVQVLKGYDYGGLLGQMGYYTTALGVQCSYCHNQNNYAYDTPMKKIARTMQIMSNGVTNNWVDPVKHDYPNYAVTGAVGCVTCHRGQPHMGVKYNIVPVGYLDYKYKSTKMAGYVVNSMYSAAKSLGQNCLFCHNSADFISLQYYPTNKIAHRMWAMVDEINHKYLPANIKAVTCYTCHQGAKWPSALVEAGLNQNPVQAVAAHPEVHLDPAAHLASGRQ